MEQIASKHLLLPIIPWFLEKYKPWTAKQAVIQQLYLGRNPPKFTGIRIPQVTGDDDMVLELGLDFLSGEDMTAILAVQLRKRLAFGMWAKMHVTGMHVEGKVLVGLKFIPEWPFLKCVSVCFIEPPHFQMTVKPIFQHGLDVSELPGIAGWLDKILAVAFEQTLVEPNLLVVDVEKFASENPETWFTVDEKLPIAFVKLEIVEAADMQPSDLNGLADPYVKGQLGPYRFRTKIRTKTLTPKWHEEFKIPISSWEAPNVLVISVYDKDHLTEDDPLGDCIVKINSLRDGERHDMWLNLLNIKMGRLHLAITVLEEDNKKCSNRGSSSHDEEVSENAETVPPRSGNQAMHHHDTDVSTTWESSRGRNCDQETRLHNAGNEVLTTPRSAAGTGNFSNTGEYMDGGNKVPPRISVRRGLHKIGAMFSPRQQKVNGKSFSSSNHGSIGRGNRWGASKEHTVRVATSREKTTK